VRAQSNGRETIVLVPTDQGPTVSLGISVGGETARRTSKSPFARLFSAGRRKPKREESDGAVGLKNPFDRADAEVATLRIGTNAGVAVADVFVDGKRVGPTPIAAFEVSPGKHTVQWKWPDGRVITEQVTVNPGETRTLKRG
jgi:hypothetical protein